MNKTLKLILIVIVPGALVAWLIYSWWKNNQGLPSNWNELTPAAQAQYREMKARADAQLASYGGVNPYE
jgi:hypothetical protein